jgi:hypothetical protein
MMYADQAAMVLLKRLRSEIEELKAKHEGLRLTASEFHPKAVELFATTVDQLEAWEEDLGALIETVSNS